MSQLATPLRNNLSERSPPALIYFKYYTPYICNMLGFTTAFTPVVRGVSSRFALCPRLRQRTLAVTPARLSRHVAPMCSVASPSNVSGLIETAVKDNPVFLATKTTCPYCAQVKSLLRDMDVDMENWSLDEMNNGPEVQDALQKLTGQRTVPNVFIGGKHIGGCSDIMELDANGELDGLIKSASVV